MNRAIVLFIGLGLATALYAWTTPERIDRRPDDYVVYMVTAAANDRGGIHAAWSECKRGTYYEKTMHAFRVNDTWSIPENISRDSGDLRWAAITLDTAGRPFVVWSEEGAARLRYVRFLGDTWTLPRLVASTNGIEPQLVTDSRDRIHLVFEGFSGEHAIWYSQFDWTGDSWSMPAAIARGSDALGRSRVAVDRFDHLHAVWKNWSRGAVDYAFFDGANWSAAETLPDPAVGTPAPDRPSITVDSVGVPFVVWGEGPCYFTFREGLGWAAPSAVASLAALWPLIQVGEDGRANVVSGGDDELWHVVRVDTGWTAPESIVEPSLALPFGLLNHDSSLHLVWRGHSFRAYYCYLPHSALTEPQPARPMLRGSGWPTMRRGSAQLDVLGSGQDVDIRLFGLDGQCLQRWQAPAGTGSARTMQVDLSHLAEGVYVLRLLTPMGRQTRKLVLLK